MPGPLSALKVIEFAGIGPAPMAGMLLADLGADVVRIDRPGGNRLGIAFDPSRSLLNRGKRTLQLDLKDPAALRTVHSLIEHADILIEGFRPGVMERLGLGPEECRARNPRLVYGRVTGWGREGPLAEVAGHDINYIAITGALAAIGPRDGKPTIPLNLLGDFAGGSLYLALGILAAIAERQASGQGQVVDAAMIDGAASLMTTFFAQRGAGALSLERESNLVDGGAPFYSVYRTADGKFIAVGAIERNFFANLVNLLSLDPAFVEKQHDRTAWPALRKALEETFAKHTREEWTQLLEQEEACVSPVLDIDEVAGHPHHRARGTFGNTGNFVQPAPTPRFDRTPADSAGRVGEIAEPREILRQWGAPQAMTSPGGNS